jgi:hypothetical protein
VCSTQQHARAGGRRLAHLLDMPWAFRARQAAHAPLSLPKLVPFHLCECGGGASGSTRQAPDRCVLATQGANDGSEAHLFLLQVARWQLQSAGTRYVVLAALVLAADVPVP